MSSASGSEDSSLPIHACNNPMSRQAWWRTALIPATWEVEIGEISVPGQPGHKS
jgi:hypothetical protein